MRFLIFVLLTIVSINGHCIKEGQNEEAQKSSALHSFIGGIHCGIQIGAKKTGDAIRNSFGFVKNKLTPSTKPPQGQEKSGDDLEGDGKLNPDFVYDIDVRSSMVDSATEFSKAENQTEVTLDQRALFAAPCRGYTDRKGRCRQTV